MTSVGKVLMLACCIAAAVSAQQPITSETIAKWMTELSNWSRWGKDDQKGTLNLITPQKRLEALKLVKEGVSVSLAHPVDKDAAPVNFTNANEDWPDEIEAEYRRLEAIKKSPTTENRDDDNRID